MDLSSFREAIDAVDAELIPLFCRRMEIAASIAAYKQAHGLAIRDGTREAKVLDQAAARAKEPFAPYVRDLYTAIFEASRSYQYRLTAIDPVKPRQPGGLRFGLIGRSLAHSLSPQVHALLTPAYAYELFALEPDEVAAFIRRPDIGGLNVTIPYKQTVLPLCDTLSPQAERIDSVNTLVYDDGGGITGHNTDYDGFLACAKEAGVSFGGYKAIILGSGGTARMAAQAAIDEGAREVVVISRTGKDNYENLARHRDADLLINATPVGMYPHVEETPVSLDGFPNLCGVLDAIYNPLRTGLVLAARERGIPAAGGLTMLVAQASSSAGLFLKAALARDTVKAALSKIRIQTENIVLIGMPGCGKTTVGRQVARASAREFVDTDEMVQARTGMSIEAVFANQGETAFRRLEREAVAEAARRRGVVIATGGGTVLDPVNRTLLSQNGRQILLLRPLPWLATAQRPLSGDIYALARARMPVYRSACDAIVSNNETVQAAAGRVWEVFEA